MAELNYQSPDDARREKRADFWMKLFGVSKLHAWTALANEIGARVEKGGFWWDARVVADFDAWQIILDGSEGKGAFTRLRAPFVNRDGFRFRIYEATAFSDLGMLLLGMQDVEIGEARFDTRYVIQSNDPGKVRSFLLDVRLRELIWAHQHSVFEVKDDDGWFGRRFPDGVDEMSLMANGLIKDVDQLRLWFELFACALERLCEIGSAADYPPDVHL